MHGAIGSVVTQGQQFGNDLVVVVKRRGEEVAECGVGKLNSSTLVNSVGTCPRISPLGSDCGNLPSRLAKQSKPSAAFKPMPLVNMQLQIP